MIRLDWVDEVQDEWANIYVTADPTLREVLAKEMEHILLALLRNPLDVGEAKAPYLRVVIGGPLVVWFKVSAEATAVRIVRVTCAGRP